ncbi:MAG: hypothetical protein II018_03200 [Firmicutes bacterium]|nr:hypothetical protein [Bacillota bacterium]
MIRLTEITEDNWLEAADLSVRDDQKGFVAPAIGIIARGYVYRDCNGRVYAIEDDGTIESWLKDNKAYITYSSSVDNGGKHAITHFHVLKRTADHTLMEFKLETGRKNQIRVHAAEMGHPVCGDVKYGNGDDPLHRLCLHAYMLCFYHPITHKPLEFTTTIPFKI